jgi:non-specific protein-tyrosine kinase
VQHEGSRPGATGDIRELLGVLRKRKWSILLITILTVGSALFFSFRQTPLYDSTAQVLVTPTNVNQLVQGVVPAAGLVSMDTEREIAASSAVAQLAAERLGTIDAGDAQAATAIDAGDVQAATTINVPTNTQLLEITFSSPDPAAAQVGARAVSESYLEFRGQSALDNAARVQSDVQDQLTKLDDHVAGLQTDLAELPAGSPEAPGISAQISQGNSDIAFLRSKLVDLRTQSVDPGQIVAEAELPTSPSSPNHLRNGALALIVGLALAFGLAFLRERLDDRLAGREDFEMRLGAPTLAVVPKIAGWRRRDRTQLAALAAPKGSASESYRTVRTNLQFIARDNSFKVLAVTSPSQGEGKTTTVANLAVTLTQTGKRVVALSCDLRKPRLHDFFALRNDVGLSSLLSGQASVRDAAQRPAGVANLRVISSGPIPPNPAELLGSEEMESLLFNLRRLTDFIVIDTPPVLAVSDALVLAPNCDGFVVLADAGTTSASALTHAREQLEQVGANIVGGILNNFDPANARYYPAYYRYYYAYQQRPEVVDIPSGGNGQKIAQAEEADLWH